MTMTPGMPFGGMPGVGAAPGQAAAPVAFSMTIPPDMTWEPFETTDVLEMDGFYACQISKESARAGDKPGVWFTLVIQDEDAKGKVLNRFLQDARTTQKDTWFQWRGLLRSIYGDLNAARAGLNYAPGAFTGAFVYVKTGAYADRDTGAQRTGIDNWSTKTEWEEARKTGRHRWKPQIKNAAPGGQVGMLPGAGLPGGLPAGFATPGGLPGAPSAPGGLPMGGGLPGAPSGPMPTMQQPAFTPQPGGAPMQQPTAPTFAPPPPTQPVFAPPPGQPVFTAPPAPAAGPPAPAAPFSFAQPPSFPMNGAATPQPPPTAAGLATSFPVPGQG